MAESEFFSSKLWNEKEIEFLKENWQVSNKELSFLLNRSEKGIKVKKVRLGLVKYYKHILPQSARVLSEKLAYIIGVILGDGNIEIDKRFGPTRIQLKVCDKDFAEYFSKILEKWASKKPKFYENIKASNHITKYGQQFNSISHYYNVRLNSSDSARFLVNFLKTGWEKSIKIANENIRTMFIKGFFDSEGSVFSKSIKPKHYIVTFYNKNQALLVYVKELLESLGIKKTNLYERENHIFTLSLSWYSDVKKFYEKIGSSIFRKNEKLKSIVEECRPKYDLDIYQKVKKLREERLKLREISERTNVSISQIWDWCYKDALPRGYYHG